jgi:hypothetical protein
MGFTLTQINIKKTNGLNSIIIHLFLLFSTIGITDSLSVHQGSPHVYEINIDKGITFRGVILLSDSSKPITIEIHDPSGEIVEKATALKRIEISFVTAEAGMYEIKFYNFESESSVELTFSYDVKRDISVIPAFSFWAIFIGTVFFLTYSQLRKRNLYSRFL